METTSKMAAAQETGLRNDEPARSPHGSNPGHAVGVATPRVSIAVDDTRQARAITNARVAEALGGLPPAKMHCSVLAEEAIRSALADLDRRRRESPTA